MKKWLAVLLALMLMLACSPVSRAADDVPYIDETGTHTIPLSGVTVLMGTNPVPGDTLSTGWYLAQDCSFSNRLTVYGTVHLILADGCTMTANQGINVAGTNALHIYGQSEAKTRVGKLVAEGRTDNAAIGGNGIHADTGENCGSVSIHSGAVEAKGSDGAGIGGGGSLGNGGSGGDIRITGGFVNAQSLTGAGIGGGRNGNGGNITITGGEVVARSTNVGAGIGGGGGGDSGTILIRGGTVTATSDQAGAGIGGGVGADGGTITIEGGSVTANGGTFGGAGIGGGHRSNNGIGGDSGTIIIRGDAQVEAHGGAAAGDFGGGAGIGSGGGYRGQTAGAVGLIVVNVPVNATGGAGSGDLGGGAKIGSGGSATGQGAEAGTKIILTKPNPATVDTGAQVSFSVAVAPADPSASYAWQKRSGAGWTDVGTGSAFTIQSAQMADDGDYRCEVSIGGEVYPTETARLTVKEPPIPIPTAWSLPKTFRATKGFSYQPVEITSGSPSLSYKLSNKKAKIDKDGVLTAKSTGCVTLTAKDSAGASMKCKVTVVGNSFKRTKPLMIKGQAKLFSSAKRLYYKNRKLYAEVFVYNRTGKSIRGAGAASFELRDGDSVLFKKEIPEWNFKTKLKNKRYKVYKITITEAMLPGVAAKDFDLGHNEIHALLTGPGVEPLTASMQGVTKPKGAEAILSLEPVDPPDPGALMIP